MWAAFQQRCRSEAVIVGVPVFHETIVVTWVNAFNAQVSAAAAPFWLTTSTFTRCGWAGLPPRVTATTVCGSGSRESGFLGHEDRVVLHEARGVDAGRVFASGSMILAGEPTSDRPSPCIDWTAV
jgi:hypothetical protein